MFVVNPCLFVALQGVFVVKFDRVYPLCMYPSSMFCTIFPTGGKDFTWTVLFPS